MNKNWKLTKDNSFLEKTSTHPSPMINANQKPTNGRPRPGPKSKTRNLISKNDDTYPVQEIFVGGPVSSGEKVVSSGKRGRGRPPKSSVSAPSYNDLANGKRRGRPPKSSVSSAPSYNDLANEMANEIIIRNNWSTQNETNCDSDEDWAIPIITNAFSTSVLTVPDQHMEEEEDDVVVIEDQSPPSNPIAATASPKAQPEAEIPPSPVPPSPVPPPPPESPEPPPSKIGLCDECGSFFTGEEDDGENLADHICGPTLCPGCGDVFPDRHEFKIHQEKGCDIPPLRRTPTPPPMLSPLTTLPIFSPDIILELPQLQLESAEKDKIEPTPGAKQPLRGKSTRKRTNCRSKKSKDLSEAEEEEDEESSTNSDPDWDAIEDDKVNLQPQLLQQSSRPKRHCRSSFRISSTTDGNTFLERVGEVEQQVSLSPPLPPPSPPMSPLPPPYSPLSTCSEDEVPPPPKPSSSPLPPLASPLPARNIENLTDKKLNESVEIECEKDKSKPRRKYKRRKRR